MSSLFISFWFCSKTFPFSGLTVKDRGDLKYEKFSQDTTQPGGYVKNSRTLGQALQKVTLDQRGRGSEGKFTGLSW